MAENTEQKGFKCNGDCMNCRSVNDRRIQWQFCASQLGYNSMKAIGELSKTLALLQEKVENLSEKIEAIQNNEASLLDPTNNKLNIEPVKEIAQKG